MNFPEVFGNRFDELNRLTRSSGHAGNAWLVRDRQSGEIVRLKLQPLSRKPDMQAQDELSRHGSGVPGLLLPKESGTIWRWYFQIYDHMSGGDLEQYLQQGTGTPDLELCLEFVRQIHATLEGLHGLGIVHGDIKPSNILIVPGQEHGPRFLLTDFDTSVWLAGGQQTAPSHGHTLTYCAPEVFGSGLVARPSDYWSLGMTLVRWLLGYHPLRNQTDQQIRELLATTWRPPFPRIEDTRFRALIGGLMDREPTSRWGHEKLGQWLNSDPGILAEGLLCANESASDVPFNIAGCSVVSDRDLAKALLENWHPLTDHDECEALGQWLRQHLGRHDLADRLQGFLDNASLNDDTRLLSFSHELVADLPPLWRGRALSAENLCAAARAAMQGDNNSLAWLQSLQDGACFNFYGTKRHIAEMGIKFLCSWTSWRNTWDDMLQAGAPENCRPADEVALPELVLALFDAPFLSRLERDAERMFEPKNLLLRAPWFLRLGTDLQSLDEAQLLVLKHLDETSRLAEYSMPNLGGFATADPAAITEQVIVLESQQRLISGRFAVPPGSEIVRMFPGTSIKPSAPDAQIEIWEGIPGIWRRFGNPQRKRNPELLAILQEATANSIPSLEVRLIRMTDTLLQRLTPNQDEAYMAQVSWQFAEGQTGKLVFRTPGLFVNPIKMKTPRLPNRGSMLLVLTSDTRIQLQTRQSMLSRTRRTRPIDILFSWRPNLLGHRDNLRKAKAAFLPPRLSMRALDEHLIEPTRASIKIGRQIIKPTLCMNKHKGGVIKINQPAFWQLQLWHAYSRLPIAQQESICAILFQTHQASEGAPHVQ